MDFARPEQGLYRWGRFSLDPGRRTLRCDAAMLKVADRLFEVLLYFVTNHGRVVTREELLQAVWAGRIVEDGNVAQAISELRKVLKACGSAEQSIVTVPGKGYRFAEPVTFEAGADATADTRPDARVILWWRAHLRIGSALLVLMMLAGFGIVFKASLVATSVPRQPVEREFAPPAHSIAVLAFDNMTGDPAQTYFSDGLSEQLIDSLTRIDAIEVAGRTSSFSFRGSHSTIGQIARALNVSSVLVGSLRRSGRRVVVTAQLTDAQTGFNIWSSTFNRDQSDVVDVEAKIATAVVQALQLKLAGADAAKLALGGTSDPAAYDFYLRGSQLEHSAKQASDHEAALVDFDQAVRHDPGFARAYSGQSKALTNIAMLSTIGSSAAQHKLFQEALTAANKAVALAPAWGQSHSQRAWVLNFGLLDHKAAEREMEQALLLAPGSSAIEGNYANIELAAGHLDRAVTAGRRGTQIDPLSVNAWGQYARILFMGRRYGEAVDALHHASVVGDSLPAVYVGLLGGVLLMQGHPEAASKMCTLAATDEQKEVLAIAAHRLGRQADAQADLAKLRADQGDAGAFSYAEIYAQWGQKDQALAWLHTAARLRDPGMAEITIDPMLDPIRNEPRFKQVIALAAAAASA